MSKIISEITPITDQECFFLEERHKREFTYPMHKHQEFELNFVSGARGARRVVGDSLEILSEYDLCLLGRGVEHEWQQHQCRSNDVHEITVQFAEDLVSGSLANRNCFGSINQLLKDAELGVTFDMPTILRTYHLLEDMINARDEFHKLLKLLEILYGLSQSDYRKLATSSFVQSDVDSESRRVQKVTEYVAKHFKGEIYLNQLANIAGMTPSAFSRFFRITTHRSISDYIIDVRLGYAARKLANSSMSILEICYTSGFNNISYFNRIFKKKKGCTPTQFRNNYRKTKLLQ